MKLFIVFECQEFGIKKPKHPNKNPKAILEVAFIFFSLVVLCQMDNTISHITISYWHILLKMSQELPRNTS